MIEIESDSEAVLESTSSQKPSYRPHLVSSKVLSSASPSLGNGLDGNLEAIEAMPEYLQNLPSRRTRCSHPWMKIGHSKQEAVLSYVNPDPLINIAIACRIYDGVPESSGSAPVHHWGLIMIYTSVCSSPIF